MSFLVDRSEAIDVLVNRLIQQVPELALVKPYQGEIDRYRKQRQIRAPEFPAVVNLATPFALVISKKRERDRQGSRNQRLSFTHEFSVYVGVANEHDFGSTKTPDVFSLLTRCSEALHGFQYSDNAVPLEIVDDGEYLITTDLFTVYDQKYESKELAI